MSMASVLKEKRRNSCCQEVELGVAHAPIGREKRVIHDCAERVCSSFTFSMRAQSPGYRDRLESG